MPAFRASTRENEQTPQSPSWIAAPSAPKSMFGFNPGTVREVSLHFTFTGMPTRKELTLILQALQAITVTVSPSSVSALFKTRNCD
jgi:hypothetical protein